MNNLPNLSYAKACLPRGIMPFKGQRIKPLVQKPHQLEPWILRVLREVFMHGVEQDVEPIQERGRGAQHLHHQHQDTVPEATTLLLSIWRSAQDEQ